MTVRGVPDDREAAKKAAWERASADEHPHSAWRGPFFGAGFQDGFDAGWAARGVRVPDEPDANEIERIAGVIAESDGLLWVKADEEDRDEYRKNARAVFAALRVPDERKD